MKEALLLYPFYRFRNFTDLEIYRFRHRKASLPMDAKMGLLDTSNLALYFFFICLTPCYVDNFGHLKAIRLLGFLVQKFF